MRTPYAAAMPGRPPKPRLTARGVALVAAAYTVLAVFYTATIRWPYTCDGLAVYLAEVATLLPRSLLDYGLKGLLTLPVWWLVLRLLHGRPAAQLAAHALALPLWVWAWFSSYHALAPALGYGTLEGAARAWDVYIPALVYLAQFGALHAAQFVAEVRQRAEAEREILDGARRAELSALKAQLNPHFLFNTLNSISASVPPEQEHTRSLVSRLAHLMRYALDASRRDLVLLDEELRFTEAYLALEQERLGDRLSVAWDVEPEARSFTVPPMIVQPLVENAVRHGLAPSVTGGTVEVRARLRDTTLAIEVRDTGLGL
ncbi:MAG: histidine kinase, partial [Bacteroidota bacterium]